MITAVGPTIVYQRHLDQMVEQLWTAWEHPMDAGEVASGSRGFCCRKLFRRCVAGWNLCVFRNRCGGRDISRKRGEWARPTDHSSALFVSHVIMYDGSRWYWPLHLPITTFLRAILASLSNYNSTCKPGLLLHTTHTHTHTHFEYPTRTVCAYIHVGEVVFGYALYALIPATTVTHGCLVSHAHARLA